MAQSGLCITCNANLSCGINHQFPHREVVGLMSQGFVNDAYPFCKVKLPEVKWINFNMHKSQFLGQSCQNLKAWSYTWKAILLASGVAHEGRTDPARFLLSEYDDYALAVLLRTTIAAQEVEETEILTFVTGKSIFNWVLRDWAEKGAIEIVYPSQLSKEEAAKFSVRGEPLQVIEYKAKTWNEG